MQTLEELAATLAELENDDDEPPDELHPFEPDQFWRAVAVELVVWVLDEQGFNRADDALSGALAQLKSKRSANAETTAEHAGRVLVNEFEGMAWDAAVVRPYGPPCRDKQRAPLGCSLDFTGRCEWCGERKRI